MKAFAIITLLALISANVYASELQTDAIEVAGYGSIIGGALKIDGHIDRLIKSKGRELETLDLSEIENLKIGDILKEAGKIGALLGGRELEDAEIQDFPLLPLIGGAIKVGSAIAGAVKGAKGKGKGKEIEAFDLSEIEALDLNEIENFNVGEFLKGIARINPMFGGKELEEAEIQDFPLLPLIGGAIKVGSAIAGAVKGAKGKGKGKEIEAFVRGEIENMKIIGNKLPLERKGLEEAEIQDFPLIPLVTGAIKVGSAIAGAVKGAKGKGKGKEIEAFDLSQIETLDLNEIEDLKVGDVLKGLNRINPMFGGKELEEAEIQDFSLLPLIGGAIKVGSAIAGAVKGAKGKGKGKEIEAFDLNEIEALDLNEIENFNVREFLQGIARINPMFGGKELEEAETEDFAILPLIGGAIKVGSMIAGAIKHKGKALEVEENFLA